MSDLSDTGTAYSSNSKKRKTLHDPPDSCRPGQVGLRKIDAASDYNHDFPPPPPPCSALRLVVHHSATSSSLDLLPVHLLLAVVTCTTTIGRDRSFEPRIRLKSLEVSKTHATLFQEEGNDNGSWFIVDNASTHGTFVRRHLQSEWERLSEKGTASAPRLLEHLDTIKIATQRFHVHIHAEPSKCNDCTFSPEDDPSIYQVPLDAQQPVTKAKPGDGQDASINLHGTIRTKEEKQLDHKADMRSLKRSMLAAVSSRGQQIQTHSGNNSSDGEGPPQRYIDRASLRRQLHGLRNASSVQALIRKVESPSSTIAQPSYGPGKALYDKMRTGSTTQHDDEESDQMQPKLMGRVIDVRTSATARAGLGSEAMLMGVEEVGNRRRSNGIRHVQMERRWASASRNGASGT